MKKSLILAGMLCIGYASAQEERVGINTETPSATLNVKTKTDAKSAKNLELENQAGKKLMSVFNNGLVGINNPSPSYFLDILGKEGGSYNENSIALRIFRNGHGAGALDIYKAGGTPDAPTALKKDNILGSIGFLGYTGNKFLGGYRMGVFMTDDASATEIPSRLTFMGYHNDGIERNVLTLGSTGNVGIGIINPTHRLHIYAAADPLKLEGLQASTVATDKILVAGTDGVVKTMDKSALTGGSSTATAVKLPTTNSATCSDTTIGTINFGEITINGNRTTAFGFCMKNSANAYVWGYMFGGGNFTTGNATFGGGL